LRQSRLFLRVIVAVAIIFALLSVPLVRKSRAQTTPITPTTPVVAPGYEFSIFADTTLVPAFDTRGTGPTCMAFNAQGQLFVGTLSGQVLMLLDTNDDGVVDQVQTFATLGEPLGLEFRANGDLFATNNQAASDGSVSGQILRLQDTTGSGVANNITTLVDGLPSDGENQTDRLKFGPDGLLYFGQGSATDDGTPQSGMPADGPLNATMLRIDADNPQAPTVFAKGLRNPFGMAFDPVSHALFASAIGSGGICQENCTGPDLSPPDGIDWVAQGGNYGFPGCQGVPVATNPLCAGVTGPVAIFNQHVTPTSITFYTGPQAGAAQNQMFVTFLQRFQFQGGDLERFVLSGDAANGFQLTPVLPVLANFLPIDPLDGPVDCAIDPITGDIYVARLDIVTHADLTEHHNIIYRIHVTGSDSLPFIGPIQPSSILAGTTSPTTLSIIGKHLQPGAVVSANGAQLQTTQPGTFQLNAVLPASFTSSPQTINISVQNPDGSMSNVEQLPVTGPPPPPPPQLTSLTVVKKNGHVVAQVAAGANAKKLRLVAVGSDFGSGAQLLVNGSALSLVNSSSTQLTGAFTKAMVARSGTLTVQVRNSAGTLSNTLSLVVSQ
jgi:glucose/arabinose dehydrogenase